MPDLTTTNAGLAALVQGTYAPSHMEIGSQALTGSLVSFTSIGTRIAVIDATYVAILDGISYVGVDEDDARQYTDFRTLAVWAGHPDDAGSILLEIGSTGDATTYQDKELNTPLIISGGTSVRRNQLASVDISALVVIDQPIISIADDEVLSRNVPLLVNAPTGRTWDDYRWVEFSVGTGEKNITHWLKVRNTALPEPPTSSILILADLINETLQTINTATGLPTAFPQSTGVASIFSIASHLGIIYLAQSGSLSFFTVNPDTGVATQLPYDLGIIAGSGMTSHNNVLYVINGPTDTIHAVNVSTGVTTPLPNATGVANPRALASHNGVLYVSDLSHLYTVDVTAGIATALPNALGITSVNGMASHNGIFYVVGQDSGQVNTVDVTTGIATALPNALGAGLTRPSGMTSHEVGGGLPLGIAPWLSIRKVDSNTLSLIPAASGYLHELNGIA